MAGERPDNEAGRFVTTILNLGYHHHTVIIRELAAGPRRYSELAALLPDIADSALGASLRELDADDLVRRRVDPGPPLRVLYELTPLGQDLAPGLGAIEDWAHRLKK